MDTLRVDVDVSAWEMVSSITKTLDSWQSHRKYLPNSTIGACAQLVWSLVVLGCVGEVLFYTVLVLSICRKWVFKCSFEKRER